MPDEPPQKATETHAEKAPPTDDLVTTRHSLRLGRRTLDYTATTGRVVLREEVWEDGTFVGHQPKAEVSITSYVVDRPDGATGADRRPVTFAFNGGPGSSSVWLHLGLLGPRRVVMGDAGALLPPPYALADNTETLLAESDLVLIDPVSTGYSRVVEGSKAEPFHGYQGDIDSMAELIRLWTTRHERWLSPKLLLGESYGTLRAAALAEKLQTRYGMYVNGLVLVSSVLDLSSIDFDHQRNDRAHALYLPTYAAIAQHHGLLGRKTLRRAMADAEEYAARDYRWVLSQGDRLTAKERATAVRTLASLTGLSEEYVDRADLRIEHWRFFGELLRDRRLTVGRIDGRFTGPAASGIAEHMDADPSMDAISGPYSTALNHYLRHELGYHNDLPYEQISSRVHPWSFKDFEGRPIDVSPLLERAMRTNPHLRVQVAYGYFDGATPHHAAEDVIAHLHLPPELRANIEHVYYEAGHMMYVHEPSRLQQSQDLADFVRRCSPS
ncbi:S10 family peptidase [Nocardioides litoris]|uniref:S10 family peptidase n=1 Tax=Nocardioides litoris TaxID=1926648 RepID=UPI001124A716|nr:peptidase S10 [Nocardioides litoris]